MVDETAPVFALERYRAYLKLLARGSLRGSNRANREFDSSDVVHTALLKAHVKREQFRGTTEREWKGWLRRILANVIADECGKLTNKKSIRVDLDQSASQLEVLAPMTASTPSQKVEKAEYVLRLAAALEKLLPHEREAVELRHFHKWSMTDIARHLKRPSVKAVSGLLARGLDKLRKLLRDEP